MEEEEGKAPRPTTTVYGKSFLRMVVIARTSYFSCERMDVQVSSSTPGSDTAGKTRDMREKALYPHSSGIHNIWLSKPHLRLIIAVTAPVVRGTEHYESTSQPWKTVWCLRCYFYQWVIPNHSVDSYFGLMSFSKLPCYSRTTTYDL